jgi:hypothetical protein
VWTLLLVGLALAQDAAAPPETRAAVRSTEPAPPEPGDGFTFLGWMKTKASITDIGTSNPLIDGQVVGLLGGLNGTLVEHDVRAFYVEHRLNGYFTFAPPILDERVALTAGFEMDFAWGDNSYGVSGNTGGAFGADQVALQTQRLLLSVHALDRPNHELRVHLGLQFLADGPWDPTTSRPDDLFRAGGRLLFFGSDASGIAAYGRVRDGFSDRLIYRIGSYTLHEEGMCAGSPPGPPGSACTCGTCATARTAAPVCSASGTPACSPSCRADPTSTCARGARARHPKSTPICCGSGWTRATTMA